ncbi:MAG: hypothetical protein M3130_03440 [Actinomycetota bacterium]|nr:hypothetical protein [Actinomycetota bacterium]
MSRTLRGLWARRGIQWPVFGIALVVAAGMATALSFSRQAHTTPWLVMPLLLIGVVALPAAGREIALARRAETGVARLRGMHGGRLLGMLALEPLLVLLAGTVVGFAVGWLGSAYLGLLWLGRATWNLDASALAASIGIVVVGLLAVLAGIWGSVHEPLAEQVSVASRPRAPSAAASFVSVLVMAAAAVAVYRATTGHTQRPDLVVLAGPALVGLAFGHLVVWALRGVAGLSARHTTKSRLAAFLAVRELARSAYSTSSVRLLVAGGVVATLALSGSASVSTWREQIARLELGAPQQFAYPGNPVQALALTHRLDPAGSWLMAAVLVPGETHTRRAYVDSRRYDAVAAPFLGSTSASSVTDHVDRLAGPPLLVARGRSLTVAGRVLPGARRLQASVTLNYVSGSNALESTTLRLTSAHTGRLPPATAALADCRQGCVAVSLVVQSSTSAETRLQLTRIDFGGRDLRTQGWVTTQLADAIGTVRPATAGSAVRSLPSGPALAVPGGTSALLVPHVSAQNLPILSTRAGGGIQSPGGEHRKAIVLARVPALPLLQSAGAMADLQRALVGSAPTVPTAQVLVLASASTPTSVISRLVAAGARAPRTLAQVQHELGRRTGADQARSYALMAWCALAVALLMSVASSAREGEMQRQSSATLRLLGVALNERRRSARLGTGWRVVATVLGATVGGVLSVRLLLAHLALVRPPLYAAPLHTGLHGVPLVVVVVVMVLAVGVPRLRDRAGTGPRSAPAILREEGR